MWHLCGLNSFKSCQSSTPFYLFYKFSKIANWKNDFNRFVKYISELLLRENGIRNFKFIRKWEEKKKTKTKIYMENSNFNVERNAKHVV